MYDQLESRRLLSVSLRAGVLEIDGNSQTETVHVRVSRGDLIVKLFRDNLPEDIALGAPARSTVASRVFEPADVQTIDIDMRSGDDVAIIERINMPIDFIFNGRGGSDRCLLDMTLAMTGRDGEFPQISMFGGDGPDQLNFVGDQRVTLAGGRGNDAIASGNGRSELYGNGGNDTLTAGDGVDRVEGNAGNDLIFSGGAAEVFIPEFPLPEETILGGSGNDTLNGGTGSQLLDGGDDDDLINAGSGPSNPPDRLHGGDGHDSINGSESRDLIDAGAGDDLVRGGLGNDLIAGSAGNDELFGDDGADTLIGGANADTISGGGGADVISGGDANDILQGDRGNDLLEGNVGHDVLLGGASRDTLIGGLGIDHYIREERPEFLDLDGSDLSF